LLDSGKVRSKIGVKGNIPLPGMGGMEPGLNYVVHGRLETHEKWGDQIEVETWTLDKPTSREGYVKYLCRCKGNETTRGIGTATAAALYAKYGESCVEILRTDPERVAREIKHFPVESARLCSQQLIALEDTEKVRIHLHSLLSGFGFPRATVNKAIDRWGAAAAEMLNRNPYLVMNFKGCGFLRADAFYRSVGQTRFPDDPIRLATWMAALKRQAYALAYELASDTDGHVWYPVERGIKGIKDRISGADVDAERAIELARRGKIVRIKVDATGKRWLADRRSADAEECVAVKVAEGLSEEGANWPSKEDVLAADPELTAHQLEAYEEIRQSTIGLLIGSAGTGKTRLVAAIVKAILRRHGAFAVAICAPTGKAAVRCTQAMQARGVDLRARTIHSTLGVESAEDGWMFRYREGNPLPFPFIVVDEGSMVDVSLLASLLRARSHGACVLIVGDAMQLPPVGRGAPLRDLVAAHLPTGRLSHIHRNAGTVVRACTAIRDRRNPSFDGLAAIDVEASPPRNFAFVEAVKGEAQKRVLALVKEIKDGICPFDATWDVQVIVAVNQRSPLSRESMSSALQQLLNPDGKQQKGGIFRIGDKAMQTQNGFFRDATTKGKEHFVANGDIGRVVEFRDKTAVVQFFDPSRYVEMPLGKAKTSDAAGSDESEGSAGLVLAYAVTGHKMQGSQAPVAIVCIDDYAGATGSFGVVDRHWIYTAFSRAEKLCYAVGSRHIMEKCLQRSFINRRKTLLCERISEITSELPSMDDGRNGGPDDGSIEGGTVAGELVPAGIGGMPFPADLFA
jgi:exodeoxyribonuclease V alpha subunit